MNIRLGVIGAIGVDDIGDVIILETALMNLKEEANKIGRKIEFTIFALDVEKTKEQLKQFQLKVKIVPCLKQNDLGVPHNVSFKELLGINVKPSRQIERFYKEILSCNGLFFIGGGYFNEYWGDRLWPTFIIPMALAYRLNKPVYVSGVTIGPFNDELIKRLNGLFKNCHTIILRDHNVSKEFLQRLGWTSGRVILGADDILPRWTHKQCLKTDTTTNFSKYGVIHLYHWLEQKAKNPENLYRSLAIFVDKLIDNGLVENIVFLPFNYFRNGVKGEDFLYGERLLKYIKNKDKYVLLEPTREHLHMREIIKNAAFTIAGRYHPVVFSLGENTPVLGIYVNNLYLQKLQGAYEVVGLSEQHKHTIHVDDVNKEYLSEWYDIYVKKMKFPNISQNLIRRYELERLNEISKFLKLI